MVWYEVAARVGVLLLIALPAWGWGAAGHQIIAKLAAAQITDAVVRAGIMATLDRATNSACTQTDFAERLACVSTWADEVRRSRPGTAPWHFVNIPRNAAGYDAGRDCPGGECIVGALARQHAAARQSADALRFLIHFIGDISEPLHAVNDADRGGNEKLVTWFGEGETKFGPWNLHAVWDGGLIAKLGSAEWWSGGAGGPVARFSAAEVERWANESHEIAVRVAYGKLPEPVSGRYALGQDYVDACRGAVELQLRRAGARVAGVLNEMFGAVQ